MISCSFRALCDAARSGHASHPALAEFCAFPDDLTGTPPERHFIKGASLMENDPVMLGSTDALVQAFLHASPDAKWRETCKGTDIGDDFMDRFVCYCLIGAGGAYGSKAFSSYVVYMPPGLWYPRHHHPAEELYLVLTGEAEFQMDGTPNRTLRARDSAFHPSKRAHAMQTKDHPVMAYVVWRNALQTPPVLTERSFA